MAKRPDLDELDVPEWAKLALDKIIWRRYCSASPSRDGNSEPQAERND
jgi:hypothetical protein